ncbi:hypothetical protein BV898_03503 [Hypsibius exemplaris]|uniref:Uncharacterized protein n=1 Tax=Hypsibius exemplaris TaxID=2072580 RepID=A0A1W0X5J6_HYPEX|nr:hypothetical protein BV898_03503 [Hypsibius exemplaris]
MLTDCYSTNCLGLMVHHFERASTVRSNDPPNELTIHGLNRPSTTVKLHPLARRTIYRVASTTPTPTTVQFPFDGPPSDYCVLPALAVYSY